MTLDETLLGKLAEVGPHFERESLGRDALGIATPVHPASVGGVSGTAEPALVAAENFPVK